MNICLKQNILFSILVFAFVLQVVHGSKEEKRREELNKAREDAAKKQWGTPKREKVSGMKDSMPESGLGSSVHSFVRDDDQRHAHWRDRRYNSFNAGDNSHDGTNQSRHP